MFTLELGKLPSLRGRLVFMDTEGSSVDLHILDGFTTLLIFRIDGEDWGIPWVDGLAEWLSDQLPQAERVVFHYAKHDYHMLLNMGVDPDAFYRSNITCTMVREVLCNEHRPSYSLDNLGNALFKERKSIVLYEVLAERFGGNPTAKVQMPNLHKVDMFKPSIQREAIVQYAFQDLALTEKLYYHSLGIIEKEGLGRVVELEDRVLKALVELERRGVPVNVGGVDAAQVKLGDMLSDTQHELIGLVGCEVNPRAPTQMKAAFEKLGIPITAKTAGGAPSFAVGVLKGIDHPFCQLLLKARDIKTMLDSFLGPFQTHLHNGRIHTNFNQVRDEEGGTGTGRLSSSKPNLQQVPKRKAELAQFIRSLFVAPKEMTWVSGDWEQFEFRMFGHYCNDQRLIDAFQKDPTLDFHQITADLAGIERKKAKSINLGLIFGMGQGKLAKELGLPFEIQVRDGKEFLIPGREAEQLFNTYHSMFPKARDFLKKAENTALRNGYVRTFGGRCIRFPHGGHHKAGGLVFQGSSADVMKEKLVLLNDEYRKTDTEFVLVVHDEFDLIAPEGDVEQVSARVKEITEDCGLRIPILSQVNNGPNWWEASK